MRNGWNTPKHTMIENPIPISLLNDFVFCPASIYFHMVDAETEKITYESYEQLQGSAMHETVDTASYSTKSSILQGISVFSEKYGLSGKIDMFDTASGILTERKRKISSIYDGQIFQLYSYYFALCEMGYCVTAIRLYSALDNKVYNIKMPNDDPIMFEKFNNTVNSIRTFDFEKFNQCNHQKCVKCVYEPLCPYSSKECK